MARETGVHVQIAHLEFSGMDNWGGASRLIKEIAAARAQGIPVDCDQYPYDAGTNPLRNLLPSWLQEGGIAAMLARLKERVDVFRRVEQIARVDLVGRGLRIGDERRAYFGERGLRLGASTIQACVVLPAAPFRLTVYSHFGVPGG